MEIRKVELDSKIEAFIEAEQQGYEAKHGILCNYTPFCFTATVDGEIVGAISGATLFAEVYIDELVVKSSHRGRGVGRGLVEAVEEHYGGQSFDNINCCTNAFQAPGFYERCGFELEFVRENKSDPKLSKYFYIKYLS